MVIFHIKQIKMESKNFKDRLTTVRTKVRQDSTKLQNLYESLVASDDKVAKPISNQGTVDFDVYQWKGNWSSFNQRW